MAKQVKKETTIEEILLWNEVYRIPNTKGFVYVLKNKANSGSKNVENLEEDNINLSKMIKVLFKDNWIDWLENVYWTQFSDDVKWIDARTTYSGWKVVNNDFKTIKWNLETFKDGNDGKLYLRDFTNKKEKDKCVYMFKTSDENGSNKVHWDLFVIWMEKFKVMAEIMGNLADEITNELISMGYKGTTPIQDIKEDDFNKLKEKYSWKKQTKEGKYLCSVSFIRSRLGSNIYENISIFFFL